MPRLPSSGRLKRYDCFFTLFGSVFLLNRSLVLFLDINWTTTTVPTFPQSHKLSDVKFIPLEPLHLDPQFFKTQDIPIRISFFLLGVLCLLRDPTSCPCLVVFGLLLLLFLLLLQLFLPFHLFLKILSCCVHLVLIVLQLDQLRSRDILIFSEPLLEIAVERRHFQLLLRRNSWLRQIL